MNWPGFDWHSVLRTWFYFLPKGISSKVLHLLDLQQLVRVASMWRPVINKSARTTAATVHNNAVLVSGVFTVLRAYGQVESAASEARSVHRHCNEKADQKYDQDGDKNEAF